MKKFAAILILAIYLLGLVGQLIVYEYLNYRADNFFNRQVSEGRYKVNDLVEIKVPANMPDVAEWPAYEKVCGSIRFANSGYNYVKMRVTKKAIYLMCVPNYETTRISAENVIHAENIDGVQIPVKNHVPYGKTLLLDGLNFTFINIQFNSPFKISAIRLVQPLINFTCHKLEIPEQPPNVLS